MDHEIQLTEKVIACAIEVHRALGPGLLESAYKKALGIEFTQHQLSYQRECRIPLRYRGEPVGEYQVDLIVENRVIVEVKSVLHWEPVFESQILTYLRITGVRVGLLMNFNKSVLKAGIKRFVL